MKARVLVISPYNPFTPQPSGSQRWLWNRLESLAPRADVTLVTFPDSRQNQELIDRLRITTIFASQPPNPVAAAPILVRGGAILLGRLSVLAHIRDLALALCPAVNDLLGRERFDLIQVEDVLAAPLARHLPMDARRLLVLHNLLTSYFESVAASRARGPRRWLAAIEAQWVRRFERRMLQQFPVVVVLTPAEQRQAKALAPGSSLRHIPLEVDTVLFQPRPVDPESPSIAFCGTMSYPPNEEAALHLHAQILPRIRKRFPAVRCHVIGRNPTARVQACSDDRFRVTGEVEDITTYLLRANVVVVPLLTGAGMRMKILEAWALSRPVVSTSLGAEGLEYREDEHLLIADDPTQFADKVCGLLQDPPRARDIGQRGRRLVEERYSKERVWTLWEDLYGELLGAGFLRESAGALGHTHGHGPS